MYEEIRFGNSYDYGSIVAMIIYTITSYIFNVLYTRSEFFTQIMYTCTLTFL